MSAHPAPRIDAPGAQWLKGLPQTAPTRNREHPAPPDPLVQAVPDRLTAVPPTTASTDTRQRSRTRPARRRHRNPSLAASAYSGQPCAEVAVRHGATPFHDIPPNARLVRWPKTERQKMIHFAKHWPNRVKAIRGGRALVESTFSKVKELFGDRLRCRPWVGRQSEALAKYTAYNVHVLTTRQVLAGASY